MRLLAIDPGGTTGLALKTSTGIDVFQVAPDQIWRTLDNLKPDVMIIERFMFRQRSKVDFTPVEVIGVLKEWGRQWDVDIIWQTPSQVKHFWTDDRLKERNVYSRAMPHANDAVRHLLYYTEFGEGRGHNKNPH